MSTPTSDVSRRSGGVLSAFCAISASESSGGRAGAGERDDRGYLEFVLESIKRVENYAGGYYEALAINQMAQDAIVWRLAVLAEWANHYVSDRQKRQTPDIPWAEICRFSSLTGQPWDHANTHRIWALARDHLQPLRRIVESTLKKLPQKS